MKNKYNGNKTSNGVASTPCGVKLIPFGLTLTPNGVESIPYGVELTPFGLTLTPNGVASIPYGVELTPYGLTLTPNGVEPHTSKTDGQKCGKGLRLYIIR